MAVETARKLAVGYIRVSRAEQAAGHSLKDQRAAIYDLAESEGRDVVFLGEDRQTGHDDDRPDYLKALERAMAGDVDTFYVWMFDRFGRDSGERLYRAQRLMRKGVRLVSVEEGPYKDDAMDHVRAWVDKDFSERLAKKVRPNKERAAREGQPMGQASFGYRLIPQPPRPGGRYVPAKRVADDGALPTLRELFERAAAGWTTRALARWMNEDPACPPSPEGKAWTQQTVLAILTNPVYVGKVRYNRRPSGRFERCESGKPLVVPGKHDALIDQGLFDRVQQRLADARNRGMRVRIDRPPPIAAGLFQCAGCGSRMTIVRRAAGEKLAGYACQGRETGAGACRAPGYLAGLAHDALLAQVARLQGSPWQPLDADRLRLADPTADQRAHLQAALAATEAKLRRHFKSFADAIPDPTPRQLATHRDVANELDGQIAAIEAELAALPVVSVNTDDLAALHTELAHAQLGDLTRELAAAGDDIGLRALLLRLVDKAVVVDRLPTNRSRWLKVEVTWSRNVQTLLDHGLLTLAPDVGAPDIPRDSGECRKASDRAYRQRRAASANGG